MALVLKPIGEDIKGQLWAWAKLVEWVKREDVLSKLKFNESQKDWVYEE